MKVAILWSHLSGYINSCLKALASCDDTAIFVANTKVAADAPFASEQFNWLDNHYEWEGLPDFAVLSQRLEDFSPDVILVSSWHIEGYRAILKRFRGRALRILAMDNCWHGTRKQWLGVLTSRYYIQPLYDAAFVPGERQAVFAQKLGFTPDRILRGVYSCDHSHFASAYHARQPEADLPNSFIFIGRFIPTKGIETLVAAYTKYRSAVKKPWPLHCYGVGPLASLLAATPGITVQGFCQPAELPNALAQAGCLVLPSYYEPWGVVVHEATAAGLPVICSSSCGSSVHLVQDGYNGYIVNRADALHLAETLQRFSDLTEKQRKAMNEGSYRQSLQYSPQLWASNLLNRSRLLLKSIS